MLLKEKNAYSEEWTNKEKVVKYHQKFNSKIDSVRHQIELEILKKYSQGVFFDCSIGDGRFLNDLKKQVKSIKAMDYSQPFLDFVHERYPFIETELGDLEKGIDEPSNAYDTTVCLRTLFALRNFDDILKEMTRITKPQGLIIFDYGVKPVESKNRNLVLDGANVKSVIEKLPLLVVKTYNLDGFTSLIKKSGLLSRLFALKINFLPVSFYKAVEKLFSFFAPQRKLYILKKT